VHPVSRAVIERTPARLQPAVRLSVRTIDAAVADRLHGLAAELAFWVIISLPALLLTAIAAVGAITALTGGDWQDTLLLRIEEAASVVLTPATIDRFLLPIIEQLLEGGGFGLVSFAFVTTVWTASRAVKVVLVALALVYDRHDQRPGWLARIQAFALALGAIVVGAILAPLLLSGPNAAAALDDAITALDLSAVAAVWTVAYWPAVVSGATMAIGALYHYGVPGPRRRWRNELPGAVLATGGWLIGSAGLRLYGVWILGSDSVYGPLAGPIVALLWLWVTGFAVLFGAELNAQRQALADEGTAPADAEGTWPLTARPAR
jgi:membrane protein